MEVSTHLFGWITTKIVSSHAICAGKRITFNAQLHTSCRTFSYHPPRMKKKGDGASPFAGVWATALHVFAVQAANWLCRGRTADCPVLVFIQSHSSIRRRLSLRQHRSALSIRPLHVEPTNPMIEPYDCRCLPHASHTKSALDTPLVLIVERSVIFFSASLVCRKVFYVSNRKTKKHIF